MCPGCRVFILIVSSSVLQYILNEKEVQVKTELWMKQNAEYLKEQKGQIDSSAHSHHHHHHHHDNQNAQPRVSVTE